MAKQSLLWTALPNGYTAEKKFLRVSLLLSPRLEPENQPGQLGSFPDFVDWPSTLAQATFTINFAQVTTPPVVPKGPYFTLDVPGNNLTGAIDGRLGIPDSKLWQALFPPETPVHGYSFKDLSGKNVLSYPAAKIDGLVRKLYSKLARSAGDQLPTVSAYFSDPEWKNFVTTVAEQDRTYGLKGLGMQPRLRFADFVRQSAAPKDPRPPTNPSPTDPLPDIAPDLALFQLFHTPPSKPKVETSPVPPGDPKSRASWLTYERTPLPKLSDFQNEIDFHKIVAAMGQYPTLLRKLGLVIDLLIPQAAFNPLPDTVLQVDVKLSKLSPSVQRAANVSPRTRVILDGQRFQALPRLSAQSDDYQTANGLLNLDPSRFTLLQADVDGSGLKLTNFARTLALKLSPDKQVDPVTKQDHEIGAPALRNAGLMLVHNNRAVTLKNTFARQLMYNETAKKIQGEQPTPPPVLFGEDLVRGWRIDIWDDKTNLWHSLCRRHATYKITGADRIEVDEEGAVRLATTTSPDPTSNPDIIWLHEAVVSWSGWSLCAPPPGKTIRHEATDHTDPVRPAPGSKNEVPPGISEVPPGIRLTTTFTATPNSLPRLRYGRKYLLRARAVDLAGNSLPPPSDQDLGPKNAIKTAETYFRYDPISAPALALLKPTADTVEGPAEGESMDRVAIRTFNDTFNDPARSTQKTHRCAVPSRTTHREAEHHGMLDRGGLVDPGFFETLVRQDNSLAEEKIKTPGPTNLSDSVEVGYAVRQESDRLPYLPEPLAIEIAARIFDLPDFSSETIIPIRLYGAGSTWPEALPFKIELYEKRGDTPRFDEVARTLFIPLPKGVRATLRLSVKPTQAALDVLGVWNWLTPSEKKTLGAMARNGQHWMLTPWREVELVHAVQKPLVTPEIGRHRIVRLLAETSAQPIIELASCSIKSTDHLDLLAAWNEPDEHLGEKGQNLNRSDHAYAVKITEAKSYAGPQEYHLESLDFTRVAPMPIERPDFVSVGFDPANGAKIHEFHDTRYRRIEYWLEATTAFREYMPVNLISKQVEEENEETEPVDEHIKVTGPHLRTWIPNSAPAPAPEVLYVVPTFGWVRSHDKPDKSTWRRGGGLRVYLNRPWNASGYGEMLAVVLPSESFKDDPNTSPKDQPLKNFVTQWGNDPIWLSAFVSGTAPKRADFPLARTARDPEGGWLPSFAPKDEADQPPGPFLVTGLSHPELKPVADPQGRVEVAPHDVFFDEGRQLWYCDIEVKWGSAYYPFIRLALARYQPVSIANAHLSHIVLADFMSLAPDRWLSVTGTKQIKTRQVTVVGSTFRDSSSHIEAKAAAMSPKILTPHTKVPNVAASSVFEVWVERLNPALGPDFGWERESGAVIQPAVASPREGSATTSKAAPEKKQNTRAKELLERRQFDTLLRENLVEKIVGVKPLWNGTATLPQAPEVGARYRLAIAEYEEYLVDGPRPYDAFPTMKDRRLVFIEYVEWS